MAWFDCPHLGVQVELTDERVAHIRRRHSNVEAQDIANVLAFPDTEILRPWRPDETMLVAVVDDAAAERHIVVVIVRDEPPTDVDSARHSTG